MPMLLGMASAETLEVGEYEWTDGESASTAGLPGFQENDLDLGRDEETQADGPESGVIQASGSIEEAAGNMMAVSSFVSLAEAQAGGIYSIYGNVSGVAGNLRNVMVMLYDDNNVVIDTETTSGLGFYAFADLANGLYTLIVSAGVYDGNYYEENSQSVVIDGISVGQNISLTEGTAPGDYSITGTVSNSDPGVSSRISNVTIELYDTGTVIRRALSDRLGGFSFGGLADGTYTVLVPAGIYNGEYYDECSQTVIIESDDVMVSLRLSKGNVPGTYSIWGSVTERETTSSMPKNIDGITVELYDEDRFVKSTTSSSAGRYSFNSIENGTYIVKIQAGIYKEFYYSGFSEEITIAGDDERLNIRIVKNNAPGTYSITGSVFSILYPLGSISGITVSLYDSSDDLVGTATTQSSGMTSRYTFYSIPNGDYTLKIPAMTYSGEDYAETIKAVTVNDSNSSQTLALFPVSFGQLLVAVDVNEGGTASASPDSTTQGTLVTLNAVPDSGYQFKWWEIIVGSPVLSSATASTATFSMPAGNVWVRAIFETVAVKADQDTLSISDPGSKTFGDAPFQLETTGGSGTGSVTYSYVSGPGTVTSGGIVTITGAGSIVTRATKAGDANYNAATSADFTIVADKADFSVNTAISAGVTAGEVTTGKQVALPALPAGATYGTPVISGALIDGTPTVTSNTLAFDTTNQADGTTATITIPINWGANYTGAANVTVTVTAKDDLTIYDIIDHFGTWNGTGDLEATIDADHIKFSQLLYNGNPVDPSNYETRSGSTIITLYESHLQTLASGSHIFLAEFSDGYSANISLTVAPSSLNNYPGAISSNNDHGTGSPNTGDETNIAGWWFALLYSMAGIIGLWFFRRLRHPLH